MRLPFFSCLIIYSLLFTLTGSAQEYNDFTGLKFSGNYGIEAGDSGAVKKHTTKEKTKIEIGGTKGFDLGDVYSVSFRFCVYLNQHFASVFEIENGNYSIRLRYIYHPDSSNVHLQLKINGKHNIISFVRPLNDFVRDNWFDLKLDVNETNNKIALTLNGTRKQAVNKYLSTDGFSVIRFGKMLPDGDCLAIILKNLKIYKDNKLVHFWRFNETEGHTAFDSEGTLDLEVTNPEWILGSRFKWRPDVRPVAKLMKNVMPFYRLVTNNRKAILEEKGTGAIIGDLLPIEGDSIDFVSAWLDTFSLKLFIAVAVTHNDRCEIKSLSIVTPVVSEKNFVKFAALPPSIFSRHQGTIVAYSALFILALALPSTAFFMIKKRKSKKNTALVEEISYLTDTTLPPVEKLKNTILLFGGLRLMGPDGNDIHGGLSAKLQELLAALLLYSASNENRAVSLRKLEKIIWSDIPKENLKNNRNAAFSKLRKLTSEMKGISIKSDSENVIITVAPEITNEATEFYKLLNLLSIKAKISSDPLVENFIKIIKGGILLQGINSDWIEKERFSIANKIIDILLRRCEYLYHEGLYEKCNEAAGLINIYDPANEDSFRFKLKSLFYLGRHSLVEETYASYCTEYQTVYGHQYPHHVSLLLRD
jgi:two-component SAPR family response regulator